ncbi:hypothetical protein [Streptomyces oceani]|uniref:Uncharacterized protein n=1 Tax=Streptomyces oceani TaxID=1075402 RepID=A0A1E7KFR8_9ACTN|nr:hypothetical protein [Streptomyces oceani]OEV02745.1 hypothetical protein AN216_14885 [Streptomyces oceani]
MKNLARAAATVGAIIGIAAFAAPVASAASTAPQATPASHAPAAAPQQTAPQQSAQQATPQSAPQDSKSHPAKAQIDDITVYYVQGDAVMAQENGPGDQANYLTKDSKHVSQPAQNEAIKTGDIKPSVVGKHNTVPVEVEGSEQDQGQAS